MKGKVVFSLIAAAICAVTAGMYVDEAIRAFSEGREWDKVIKEDTAAQNEVQENEHVHKTE